MKTRINAAQVSFPETNHALFPTQETLKFEDNQLLDEAIALLKEAYADEEIQDSQDLKLFRDSRMEELIWAKQNSLSTHDRKNVIQFIQDLKEELAYLAENKMERNIP